MTARPHCGKCQSTSVYQDTDLFTNAKSIACLICGNRWPGGAEFYMAEKEEGNMATRATCKNCDREGMTIIKKGLCFTCATVSDAFPDPGPERDKAMAAAHEKAKNLPGPHENRKRTDKTRDADGSHDDRGKTKASKPAERKRACANCGRIRFISRSNLCGLCSKAAADLSGDGRVASLVAIKEKIESDEVRPGKRISGKPAAAREKFFSPDHPKRAYVKKKPELNVRRCRVCGCTDDDCAACISRTGQPCHWVEDDLCSACNVPTALPSPPPPKPIIIQIAFSGEDISLYNAFQEYCRRTRRDLKGQILFLIDDIVRDEEEVAQRVIKRKEFGIKP